MPYIPSKEKQKCELNFIRLIKSLMDINQKKTNQKNDNYLNIKTSTEDPYKPKGYNYYSYSREHPTLIKDGKEYIKIVQELNKISDNNNNNKINEKRCLSYSNINNNEIEKNNIKLYNSNSDINVDEINDKNEINDTLDNNNNKRTIPISKYNSRYVHTINNDNLMYSRDENYNDEIKFNTIKNLPIISSRQYQNSFQNDSKNKNNTNNNVKKKASINEVGWGPKDHNLKSRINTSSVAFNIISPSFKSISPTKRDIDIINNNNSYKSNLMSEFIDMCKPGDSELRKDYINKLNANKNILHRKNYCSSLYDIHHDYKDLILDVF